MKLNLFKYFAIALVAPLALSSCIKNNVTELKDQGSTFVKILQAPQNALFFSPFQEVKPVDLFSLRKDDPSSSALNTPLTVTLAEAPEILDAYNEENGTSFEWLPDSLYTLAENFVKNGSSYTASFNSGEFAKEFTINLDGSKWDLAYKYAMAFTVSDANGKPIPEGKDQVLVLISIKNKWDGVYEVTGSYSDLVFPAFTGLYPYTWELQTLSANSCVVVDNYYLGIPGFTFDTDGSGALSYYGSFGLIVTFNEESGAVESVSNYYGQPSANTRSAILDETGENYYDESSKTIKIKYYMTQPSSVVDPPHIRATFNEEWKYVGER